MKSLLPVLLALALAVIAIAVLKKRGSLTAADAGPWPFFLKKPLSAPEQVLYHRLVAALPEHIVLAQVQVSRVLGVKKGVNYREWTNRIDRLSYDFVICGKDATVIAAIELDDKSHDAEHRVGTDRKKDKATADAGLRLVRWNVKTLPDLAQIRATLMKPSAETPLDTAAGDGRVEPHLS